MEIIDAKKDKKLIFRTFVGSGSFKDETGAKIEFEMHTTMGNSPIISYGAKHFIMSWQDVVELAEKQGLFTKEE